MGTVFVYNNLSMTSNEEKFNANWLKYAAGILVCLMLRLLPFRTPNIEPILTTAMPFSKVYGVWGGFFFALTSIILYDVVTGTLGKWTFLTSAAYGLIGLASAYYFKNREATSGNFVRFAIVSTIFFDAVTGLLTGPLFFGQPFYAALIGQIPFTFLHLLGNIAFAALLSPIIYHAVTRKRKRDISLISAILRPKNI